MASQSVTALNLAVDAGVAMLRAGGEIARVEETIGHIARAYGVKRIDAYATPTGLFVTGESEDGNAYTVIRRVVTIGNNLSLVAAVNDLSRRAARHQLTLAEARAELTRLLAAPPPYTPAALLAAAMVTSGASTYLFGGKAVDVVGGGLAGAAVQLAATLVEKQGWGAFAKAWAGGFLAALAADALHWLYPPISVHFVVAGAIIPLVPGLAITNALRDIMGGQLVSGVTRIAEATLVAVGVAAGVGLVIGIGAG